MPTNELEVELPCTCGRKVVARSKDAGGVLPCSCGVSVHVPRLSELRALAGKDAFVTNPTEAIKKLQRSGISPAGDKCLLCGATSPDLYRCHAVCESSHLQRVGTDDADSPMQMLWFLILPKILFLPFVLRKKRTKTDRLGYDIEVDFHLPVCRPCASMNGDPANTGVAKDLMKKVPLFAELISYYPQLRLKVDRVPTQGKA